MTYWNKKAAFRQLNSLFSKYRELVFMLSEINCDCYQEDCAFCKVSDDKDIPFILSQCQYVLDENKKVLKQIREQEENEKNI